MPPATRRTGRTNTLLKTYIRISQGRQRRALLRKRAARTRANRYHMSARTGLTSSSSDSSSDTDSSSDDSSDSWSDILGPDWRFLGDTLLADLSADTDLTSESESSEMPELRSIGSSSSASQSESSESMGVGSLGDPMSGVEGDDEESSGDDSDAGDMPRPPLLRRWVQETIETMHENRYEQPRNTLPRGPSYLRHVLTQLKLGRADHFRQNLRVSPRTFDALVAELEDDPIFSNNSNHPQLPVDLQLAVTLYRFGHDGNAASIQGVADWAGLGKGTVHLITRRVMTAVLRPGFMRSAVRMPTPEEKEKAKEWVNKHSCHRWRDGWCFVDGTLIPLDERPTWYGESYFDRKCNYSLNFQIVNLPNLQIIDFGFGHVGSTHDSVAWRDTLIARRHEELFEEDEWIWADSAYPIDTWLTAPYKKPAAYLPDNEFFNNHVSILRIRSEHAIGFLKGRFHSLKHLRVHIKDEATHKIATYWVSACIGIHNFALQREEQERGEEADSDDLDPFIGEGLSSTDSDSENNTAFGPPAGARTRLSGGKAFREGLKAKLLHTHEQRRTRHVARRVAAHGL